jgi:amino acid transporter
MFANEPLSYGLFLGMLSFGICFVVVYNYFRKLKSSRALKRSVIISGIYGTVAFILTYGGYVERQGPGPNVGVMAGMIMLFLATIINIPLHYLLKLYHEGYYGEERKQD